MKKIISCLLVLALCLAASVTAVADTVEFVPSITYKPAPDVMATVPEGHEACIVITPVSHADTSTAISKEDAQELKSLYDVLTTDGTKLSEQCPALNSVVTEALGDGKTADDLVVRDLFHVGVNCEELDTLLNGENIVKVTLSSTVADGESVFAMMYVDGKWEPIEAVNNNNGSITISVKTPGTVAIMVPAAVGSDDTQTGESGDTVLWIVVMGAALVAMVLSVATYRRRVSEK